MVRWWINLAVVLVIAGIGGLLRIREERTARERDTARSDVREIESLQELTLALAGAVSSLDVVEAARRISASFRRAGSRSGSSTARSWPSSPRTSPPTRRT